MVEVPRLTLPVRQPAGMPSSYTSRSIRQKAAYDAIRGGVFSPIEPPSTARKPSLLSQREMLQLKNDKIKYNTWLKQWDKDPGVSRYLMLKDIVNTCQGYSKAQLDELYGHSSELVFMHIYIFVRWNCRNGCSVGLQLKTLQIFFNASSGYCFAEHFLKKGGTETLLVYLKMQKDLNPEDVVEILKTFLSLTAHGPHAIDYIFDTDFIPTFLEQIPLFPNQECHSLTVMLFIQLAEGNRQHAEAFTSSIRSKFPLYSTNIQALHTAAHIFRILFDSTLAAECDVKNQIGDFLVLTSCESLDVQHEGIAIFHNLVDNANAIRRKFVFDILFDMITISTDDLPPDTVDSKLRQQTFALRLFTQIIAKGGPSLDALTDMLPKVLPALVRTLGNTENYSAQKAACTVLSGLVKAQAQTRVYLENAIPNEWVVALLRNHNQFCLEMTPTQIDTFLSVEPANFFFDTPDEPRDDDDAIEVVTRTMPTPATIRQTVVIRESPMRFTPVVSLPPLTVRAS